MVSVLVLYYSSYGHVARMADAIADGAREAGARVDVRRVPETVPAEVARAAGFGMETSHPQIDNPRELAGYDAIIVGAPTRFGRMPGQMAAFWDGAGELWKSGALVGKVGGAFTSTATQHGGQEVTLFSIITNLMHMGMIIVGLDYGYPGHQGVSEVHGTSPYGASTIADGDGSRKPSRIELDGARYQGRRIAEIAGKLYS